MSKGYLYWFIKATTISIIDNKALQEKKMKQMKYLLKVGVLLLLVGVFAATSVYAQSDEQHIGIGGNVLVSSGNLGGFNIRYWTESKFGVEAGLNFRSNWMSIPISGLYTLAHIDTNSMYIRPYVGGGISMNRFSIFDHSETKIGGQGFGGVELTAKSMPQLSFGGNLGVHNFGKFFGIGNTDFKLGLHAHYYFK